MKMESVESSNLEAVGYDGDLKVLRVQFKSGATYEYQGVPADVATGLLEAPSKGQYFQQTIRNGGYPYKRIG